jgi:GDP-L-fucose synthase
MRILVTGGRGLVGSAVEHPDVIKVTRQDYDLTVNEDVSRMYREIEPTHVLHCAGRVGGLGANMEYQSDFYVENILMNTLVMDKAVRHGVKNLVVFASTCVFPDKAEYPLTVEQLHKGKPHSSNFGYAYAKRMAVVHAEAIRSQYGYNYRTVIPCGIYGPNDNFSEGGHVIPSLIRKAVESRETGEPFVVWGTGKPLREFIYSKDVASLALKVLLEDNAPNPLILTTGIEHSIGEIAELVAEVVGVRNVVYDETKPDGQYRKPSDHQPLHKWLGENQFTDFRDGIREAVRWYEQSIQ